MSVAIELRRCQAAIETAELGTLYSSALRSRALRSRVEPQSATRWVTPQTCSSLEVVFVGAVAGAIVVIVAIVMVVTIVVVIVAIAAILLRGTFAL